MLPVSVFLVNGITSWPRTRGSKPWQRGLSLVLRRPVEIAAISGQCSDLLDGIYLVFSCINFERCIVIAVYSNLPQVDR